MENAKKVYTGILETRPDYPFAVGALADLLVLNGNEKEAEAKYKEEYNQLLYYLEDSKFSKQYLAKKSFLEGFNVHFVINKEGEATDISIIKSTGDKSMDELLKELVKNMPKWDPAKNAKGEFVSQEFELNNVMQC